jgi:SAM-dependent methyltransferase
MVEVARDRAASDGTPVTFAIHDVRERLPFADGSLGAALAILVIQHLPDPGSFVTDIRRCLRPGGHLVITAPARDVAPLTTPKGYWRLRAAGALFIPGVVRFYDRESLPRLVESAGFSVVDCDQVGSVRVMARA